MQTLPIVMVPGLLCTARLYVEQIPALWRFGPVTVADHTRDDSLPAIARRILESAPPKFALTGLSMGGYIALEIMRQAPERVDRLALLNTNARADAPEQSDRRRAQIALAEAGNLATVVDQQFPLFVHASRENDADLRALVRRMAQDTGPVAFVRQQRAIIARPDARPSLRDIRCPTLVLAGDGDRLMPPELSREMAEGIAGARLVVVPQCGHLSTLERPQEVTDALARWLEA